MTSRKRWPFRTLKEVIVPTLSLYTDISHRVDQVKRKATSFLGVGSDPHHVGGKLLPFEVTTIGEDPAAAPGETPVVEDLGDLTVERDRSAIPVGGRIEIDGHTPGVPRDGATLVTTTNQPGVETPAGSLEVHRVDLAGSDRPE